MSTKRTTMDAALHHERVLETCVERLALLETPSGFALFNISHAVFTHRDAIWSWLADARKARLVARIIEYIKVGDKSVTRRHDGPGEELSRLIKEYCRSGSGKEYYVEDEKLRRVIYSNLKIKCSDDNYVVGEVMWGLKNVMYDLVYEELANITRGYHLPPCEGLKKCISTFKFNISREAIDEKFILHAAGLYQCHTTLRTTGKDLRMACEQYVPGFSDLIEDDKLYAEVMAKILTPGLEPDWDFTQKFEEEMALKLKAADAAAEVARKEVGYQMYHFMSATFANLRGLPDVIEKAVQFINSLVKERSMSQKLQVPEKRSHADLTESSEATTSQDSVDANGEPRKKARTDDQLA